MNVCEKYARINFMLKKNDDLAFLYARNLTLSLKSGFLYFFPSFWLLTLALVAFVQTFKKLVYCSLIILYLPLLMSFNSSGSGPTLSLGIAHNYGAIWDLSWCPSGTWEPKLSTKKQVWYTTISQCFNGKISCLKQFQ